MFHIVRRWFSLEVLFRPLRPRKRWRQHRTTFAQRIESLHFESLERREMLAGDSSAQNGGSLNALGPHYNDLHDAPLIVDATYGVLAGASAPSGAPLSAILVDPPHHGSLTLNANGSFRYDPKPGYRGRDSFVFDETDVAGFHRRGIAELSVLEKWTPTQTTTVGGVRPLATPPEAVSISNTKGPEGAVLEFVISVSGAGPDGDRFGVSPGGATPGMNQRDADPGGDFNESFQTSFVVYGSGSDTVDVQTYDDERDMAFGDADAVFGVLASNANANNLVSAQATGTILEKAISHPCTCSCSCGNVEAGDPSKPQTQGGSTANSGQGDAPQDLFYQGLAMPHPIITVNDTLSSTVAQASGIMVQTTLDDMEGNVLYTSPPVYYSPTGYSQNDPVQFAQQLDAAGLAHGQYQATTSVTEEYPNGQLPIIRNYVNLVGVDNLDASPYGAGWGLKNVDRLATQTNGAALLDGSGNVSWFDIDSSGNYDVPDSRPDVASFAQNPDSSFTLTYRDGSQENFAANGLLSSTVDKNNNTTTDSWNPDSTLASVTDQAGRTTTFAYAAGLLTSVTDFGNRVTTYSYSNDQLTSITLPSPGHGEGQHVTTMGYDPTTGMLTTITDAGGTTTLAYNSFRQVIKITNPDSTSTEYTAPSSMSLVNTSGGLGTQSDPAPLVYTVSVQGSVTDGNGHRSTYATDATTGEILETVDATGVTTGQYQYNDAGQVTSIIQPPLTSGGAALTTTLGYDSNGNLNQETFPDGTSETWTYDQTWNEPTQYVDPAGRETDYTLDPNNGDVLSVTQVGQNGDANRVTTYTYTANPSAQGQTPGGLVATMTDPRGVQTAFSYNSHGLVTQITYAVGTAEQASVSFTYDANDNPASYTNELGQTTLFVYDNSNRKIAEQDPPPDPSQPSVRPTWTWTYDTRGNKLSQTDPLGRVTSYVYGPGSDGDDPDLDKVIQPDPTGGTNYTITTYGHDNADNLTSITDPLERVQSMGFDADNRQTSITLPNPTTGGSGGPTESVVYNALGFPVQQFDLAGNETDNTFNWRGQVLTSEGPPPTPGAARPVETFTYNADGQVLTDQNALGGTTQYVYNSFGEVTEEIFPSPGGGAQPTLHWTYDPDGNVASYQDANGNIYTYTYSDRNQLIQENAPSPDGGHTPAPVWQWVYDTAGQLTETIDPMQRVTQFVPDGDGNVIQTIAPNLTTGGAGDASTTTYATYNLDNEKTSETTPLPSGATGTATTSWQYNDLGQMTQETQPVPAVGETAPVWKYQVDADNELLQVTNPLGLSQTSTFNGLGQMTGQTSFAGVQTAWTYNNLSEILTETVGSGSLAQTTTNTWGALGDKLSTQDANGTTTMAYNLLGAMTSLTDPDNNQTVWTRDNLGRVIAEQNPSGSETFAYDANSNLVKQVDFDGHERDFVVDDLNRETAEKWMNGATVLNTISTSYNADGQVTSTGDNYSDYAFGYNGQGDQTSVDNAGTPGAPHVVLTNQFDALGNRTSLAATLNGTADFINNYSYDTLSRLRDITQQSQSGGNAVAPKSIYIGLDGVGDITELNYANTVNAGPQQTSPGYATLTYSPTTGLLTGINDTANGTSIDNLGYTYDALARVSTFTSIDGTATYGYDHTSQLVSAAYTTATGGHQPANVSFTWDANGNNAAPGNVVSPNNEVTNDGTYTYTFDADGNRTSRTAISTASSPDYKTTYSWDYRNRLTDVEFFDNSNVLTKHVHYVYDVYDNLIEEDIDPTGGGNYTTKEQFVLDVKAIAPTAGNAPLETFDASGDLAPLLPDDVLMELVNNQLTERFLNGPSPSDAADVIFAEGAVASLTQPDTVDWTFANSQGSPTDVVNSSGALIDHEVYSPFGQVAYASNPGVFLFQGYSGGYADQDTGLIKFGERWYDPMATAWISVDPAGFAAGDANLSRYALNSPTSAADPSGLVGENWIITTVGGQIIRIVIPGVGTFTGPYAVLQAAGATGLTIADAAAIEAAAAGGAAAAQACAANAADAAQAEAAAAGGAAAAEGVGGGCLTPLAYAGAYTIIVGEVVFLVTEVGAITYYEIEASNNGSEFLQRATQYYIDRGSDPEDAAKQAQQELNTCNNGAQGFWAAYASYFYDDYVGWLW